ncbi:hypothetical protein [Spiroplasma endosymbiont of Amphibalanus improvisus]
MKKINVFETFSGIGAQSKALFNLKQNFMHDFDYEIVYTSDWFISAIIIQ